MNGYTANITESSYASLTPQERIKLKDMSETIRLDKATEKGSVTATITDYAVVAIHNEKLAERKDYNMYLYIAKDGTKYCSGSESLADAFMDIYMEMTSEGIHEMDIEFFRHPSKNYSGKDFLSCRLA